MELEMAAAFAAFRLFKVERKFFFLLGGSLF